MVIIPLGEDGFSDVAPVHPNSPYGPRNGRPVGSIGSAPANSPRRPQFPGPAQRPATMEEALAPHQANAKWVDELSASAVLRVCVGQQFPDRFDPTCFKAYHDNTLTAAGAPTDPVEKMLIEQLLWAHHRLANLHVAAAAANSVEMIGVSNAAAARLMAECRKTSLALREYRTPVIQKQVTVLNQQNVITGDQQVAYVDGRATQPRSGEKKCDIEVASNHKKAITDDRANELTQPTSGRSREAEPVAARPADTGGPPAAAAGGADGQAVAPLDGP